MPVAVEVAVAVQGVLMVIKPSTAVVVIRLSRKPKLAFISDQMIELVENAIAPGELRRLFLT